MKEEESKVSPQKLSSDDKKFAMPLVHSEEVLKKSEENRVDSYPELKKMREALESVQLPKY